MSSDRWWKLMVALVLLGWLAYGVWWGEFHTLHNDADLREAFIKMSAAQAVHDVQHDTDQSKAHKESLARQFFANARDACRPEIGTSSWTTVPVLGTPSPECVKHAADVLSRAIKHA